MNLGEDSAAALLYGVLEQHFGDNFWNQIWHHRPLQLACGIRTTALFRDYNHQTNSLRLIAAKSTIAKWLAFALEWGAQGRQTGRPPLRRRTLNLAQNILGI